MELQLLILLLMEAMDQLLLFFQSLQLEVVEVLEVLVEELMLPQVDLVVEVVVEVDTLEMVVQEIHLQLVRLKEIMVEVYLHQKQI